MLKTASRCGTSCGRAARMADVERGLSGMKSTARRSRGGSKRTVSGRPSTMAMTTKPPRRAAVALSGWPSISIESVSSRRWSRPLPVSASAATRPATVAAADEPRPRAMGTWFCIWMRKPRSAGTWPSAQRRPVSRATTKRLSRVVGRTAGALALDRELEPRHVGDLDRDPVAQVEGERQGVVAGAEVGGRGRHVDHDAADTGSPRARRPSWRLRSALPPGLAAPPGSAVPRPPRRRPARTRPLRLAQPGSGRSSRRSASDSPLTLASSTTRAPPSRRRPSDALLGYPLPGPPRCRDPSGRGR